MLDYGTTQAGLGEVSVTHLETNGNTENLPTLIIPCTKRPQKL
jgi:hypothetical protein